MDCMHACKQCKNNGICDPVNGECRCKPGFKGEQCGLGKFQFSICLFWENLKDTVMMF